MPAASHGVPGLEGLSAASGSCLRFPPGDSRMVGPGVVSGMRQNLTVCSQATPLCGIVGVYPEEGWHSMDLCAEMLLAYWTGSGGRLSAQRLCPTFCRPAGGIPWLG